MPELRTPPATDRAAVPPLSPEPPRSGGLPLWFKGLAPLVLLVALALVFLLFGAKRIPELAKGLGTGIKEFREGVSVNDDSKLEVPGIEESRGEARADSEAGNNKTHTNAAERSF